MIQVRRLEVRDIFTVSKLLGQISKEKRERLALIFINKGPMITLLIFLLTSLSELKKSSLAWMADMIGMETKECEKLSLSEVSGIYQTLVKQDDLSLFLAWTIGGADEPLMLEKYVRRFNDRIPFKVFCELVEKLVTERLQENREIIEEAERIIKETQMGRK